MRGRLSQPFKGPPGPVSITPATAAANVQVDLDIPGASVVGNDVVVHWIAWSYGGATPSGGRLFVTFEAEAVPVVFDVDLEDTIRHGFILFPFELPLFGNGDTGATISLEAGGASVIGKLVACTS